MKTNNVSGVGGALPQVVRDVLSVPKKVEADLKSLYQQFQSEVIKPVKSKSVFHARSLYREGKWIDASKVFEAIGDRYRAMYCLHRALEAKEGVKSENYKKIAELYSSVGKTKRAKSYVNSSNYQLVRENKRSAKEFPTEKGINAATFVKNLNDPELKEHLQTVASAKPTHVEQRSVVVAKKKDDGVRLPVTRVVAQPEEIRTTKEKTPVKVAKQIKLPDVAEDIRTVQRQVAAERRREEKAGEAARRKEEAMQRKIEKERLRSEARESKSTKISSQRELKPEVKAELAANPEYVPYASFMVTKDETWNDPEFVSVQANEANTRTSGSVKEMYFGDKCFEYFKKTYGTNTLLWKLHLGEPNNYYKLVSELATPEEANEVEEEKKPNRRNRRKGGVQVLDFTTMEPERDGPECESEKAAGQRSYIKLNFDPFEVERRLDEMSQQIGSRQGKKG